MSGAIVIALVIVGGVLVLVACGALLAIIGALLTAGFEFTARLLSRMGFDL